MTIELATTARDGWELRSGEQSHRDHPETFLIPPAEVRHGLQRGDVVRLVVEFRVEGGVPPVVSERVWAMVAEKHGDRYLGLLLHDPQSIVTGDDVYLKGAAEVAFDAEHVIDTQETSDQLVAVVLGEPPTRRWPYR